MVGASTADDLIPVNRLQRQGRISETGHPNAQARGGNFSPIHYRESPNCDHPSILLVA